MSTEAPDSPSSHHLPFDKPFDRLTVLSKVEGLMALSKAEGQCLSASGGLPSRQAGKRSLLPPASGSTPSRRDYAPEGRAYSSERP